MQKNNRFPAPAMNTTSPNSRFSGERRKNPFTSFGGGSQRRFGDRNDRRPLPTNSRAAALLDSIPDTNQEPRRNPFESSKNTRFRNLIYDEGEQSSSFGNDREHNERRGNRFRGDRRNYFQRRGRSPPPKKPTFAMKKDDFPSLGTAPKKATVENKPLAFGVAAGRGKKCASPPPRPKLPPPARLPRPKKVESGDESDGWNTEDEHNARAADPSDDEEAGDPFWGEGGFNDQ
jgi:hypothetical protein